MTPAVLFSLVPAEPSYDIGEPIWLSIHIDNHGADTVQGTIETGLTLRTDKLFVTVTDTHGQRVPDAWRFPGSGGANNAYTEVSVAPGQSGDLHLDLAKYAWLDEAGTYDVRLLAPIATRWDEPEPPLTDARWVTTHVTVVKAADPAALVASVPKTTERAIFGGPHMELRPWMDVNTFDALAHVEFVPILESLASASFETESQRLQREKDWGTDPMDQRALYGLGGCPCTEATDALIRLYDRLDSPRLRGMVRQELLYRVPRPDRKPSWFVTRAWDPRFATPVLDRARVALDQPAGVPGWSEAYRWATQVIEALGDTTDGPRLVQALDRTLAMPPPADDRPDIRANIVSGLTAAIRKFPASQGAASGETQLQLELQSWDGRTGSAPPDWEAVLLRALTSDDPVLAQHALWKVPKPVSPTLVPTILSFVGSPDLNIALTAEDLLVRSSSPEIVGPLALELLESAPPWRVAPLLAVSKPSMTLDVWLARVASALSKDPANADLLAQLVWGGLTGCREYGIDKVSPGEVPRIVNAWTATLKTHGSQLRAGPIQIVPGETNPALAPAAVRCKLPSGETWP